MEWYLYIAKCADNSLYTGITKNIQRRIREHNSDNKLGAKSLRYRRPVVLAYYEVFGTQSAAAKREKSINTFSSADKIVDKNTEIVITSMRQIHFFIINLLLII